MAIRTFNNIEIETIEKDVDLTQLRFYEKNPRVYSVLNSSEDSLPSQDDIFTYMKDLENVRNLKDNIKLNGGLTDPIIVMENESGSYTVLEGNSRLAAYKMLYETSLYKDREKWDKIKCEVITLSVIKEKNLDSEDLIFTLLGTYHIRGKANWEPYEQANYLYRRKLETKAPIKSIAIKLGISVADADRMIKVIDYMKKYEDTKKSHYSYYYEYLKNEQLNQCRQTYPQLDQIMSVQISNGRIKNARDIRKLAEIAKLSVKGHNKTATKIIKEISEGEANIYEGYDRLKETGVLDDALSKLYNFRVQVLADDNFSKQLSKNALRSEATFNKTKYELKQCIDELTKIQNKLINDYNKKSG